MGSLDSRIAHALDMISPPRPAPGSWDVVVETASSAERRRRSWGLRLIAATIITAAAVATCAAFWPFSSGTGGNILDRAAAAIGDQPVLHLVLIQDAPRNDQLVNISTGTPARQQFQTEVWFDSGRDLKRTVTSINGVTVDDLLETPNGGFSTQGQVYTCPWIVGHPVEATKLNVSCPHAQSGAASPGASENPPSLSLALAGFLDHYEAALASGQAQQTRTGELEGRHVVWLRVTEPKKSPFGTQDVAVDAESYKPVLIRDVDGRVADIRVRDIATEPYKAKTFSRPEQARRPSYSKTVGSIDTTPAAAAALLGGKALWLGARWHGLQFVGVSREELLTGYGTTSSGDAPVRSEGVVFEYAADAPSGSAPTISIRESRECQLAYRWSCTSHDPGDGLIFVAPASSASIFRRDGLFLSVTSQTDDIDVIDLARDLTETSG